MSWIPAKRETTRRNALWLLRQLGIEPAIPPHRARKLTADQERLVVAALARGEAYAQVDRRFGFKPGFAWHLARRIRRQTTAARPTLRLNVSRAIVSTHGHIPPCPI